MKKVSSQENLRKAVEHVLDPYGYWQASKRMIVCTPTFGAYEKAAYWVVTLSGSPPKGTIIIQTGWNERVRCDPGFPRPYLIDSQGKARQATKRMETALDALACTLAAALPVFKKPCAFVLNERGEMVPFDGLEVRQ